MHRRQTRRQLGLITLGNWEDQMLEDDYICMVPTTLMYAICEKALMDKREKLRKY